MNQIRKLALVYLVLSAAAGLLTYLCTIHFGKNGGHIWPVTVNYVGPNLLMYCCWSFLAIFVILVILWLTGAEAKD